MGCKEGCGLCCEAIALMDAFAIRCVRQREEGYGDIGFLARHLHEIPREEAARRNPNLVRMHDAYDAMRHGPTAYFECDQYDREARSCGAYERRPSTCSEFPFYGRVHPQPLLPFETCGYWEDVPEEKRLFADLEGLPMIGGSV